MDSAKIQQLKERAAKAVSTDLFLLITYVTRGDDEIVHVNCMFSTL
jgi:hypothetical protein